MPMSIISSVNTNTSYDSITRVSAFYRKGGTKKNPSSILDLHIILKDVLKNTVSFLIKLTFFAHRKIPSRQNCIDYYCSHFSTPTLEGIIHPHIAFINL